MALLITASSTFLPGDPGYDELRRNPINPEMDPRPAMIVEAETADGARSAVVAASELGLPLAVQSTGHGTHVPADGGLLLRTSSMTGVHVDPVRRTAVVRAGTQWGEVVKAAARHGLAPLSGSGSTVGVVGYTLGGGLGWLARRYGLAADSVVRAEVVTADGRILDIGHDDHPELFWALRGGGAGFAVVTELEFELYPVTTVLAGTVTFTVTDLAAQLAEYRDWAADASPELSTAAVVTPERTLVIKALGEARVTGRLLAPLWRRLGASVTDDLRPMPYSRTAMGGTPARTMEAYTSLGDALVERLAATEDTTVEIRHWGGAIAEPGPDAGPAAHRDTAFTVVADRLLEGLPQGGAFLNFAADRERAGRSFTPANLQSLREIKRAYDPGDLFRLNLTPTW
jgi:FAD/FMN-containing dehydrogenase